MARVVIGTLVVLFLVAAVGATETTRSRHTHRHRHRHQDFAAPLPFYGVPGAPPSFAAPGMPPVGVPAAVSPAEAGQFPRFEELKQQLGLQQTVSKNKNPVDGLYNLLSKTRDATVEDSSKLMQDEKKNQAEKRKLQERRNSLRKRQQLLTRLEFCLEQDGSEHSAKANTTTANKAATQKLTAAQAALHKQQISLTAKANAQTKKDEDLKKRELALNAKLAALRKKELDLQNKANNLNAQKKTIASQHAKAAKEKVVVKYVKVPQVVYKPMPHGCPAVTDCNTCTANPECGWCSTTKQCITALNGTTGKCSADGWNFNFCKADSCKKHIHCRSCMADPRCGLCGDTGTCIDGSLTGPSKGTCNSWNYATDLRFLSYNIYGRDVRNITGRAQWLFRMIRQSDPDFIALQEVEDWFLELLAKEKWALNYHTSDFGSGHAPGGLLFMSKVGLESVSYYEKTQPGQIEVDQRARFLAVKPKMGSRSLVLATTDLDWRSAQGRVAGMEYAFGVLNGSSDVVMMGDFNFDANAEPESSHVPKEYEDLWTRLHPTTKGYTWDPDHNSYARESDPTSRPSRIDRMYVKSGFWQPSKIDKIGCPEASPHYGLLAEFSMFGAYC